MGSDAEVVEPGERISRRYRLLITWLGEDLYGFGRGWKRRVAEYLGVHPTYVSRILAGSRRAGWEVAVRAAEKVPLRQEYFTRPSKLDPSPEGFILPDYQGKRGDWAASVSLGPGSSLLEVERAAADVSAAFGGSAGPTLEQAQRLLMAVRQLQITRLAERAASASATDGEALRALARACLSDLEEVRSMVAIEANDPSDTR